MKKWVHYDRMNFLLDIDLLQSDTTSNISVAHEACEDTLVDADYCDSVVDVNSSASRSSVAASNRKSNDSSTDHMRELVQAIQQPITIDLQQNAQNPFTGFGTVVAHKLEAMSENARDRAMIRILQVLQEERLSDQA